MEGILASIIFMKKQILCLLLFTASLMFGSGCGSGTGTPADSAAPAILENRTASEDLDSREGSPPSILRKKSGLLHDLSFGSNLATLF